MGIVDAFVYAHNYHRRNTDNPGNFGGLHGKENSPHDCHPTYAHAYQSPRLAGRPFDFPCQRFRSPEISESSLLEPQHVKKATIKKKDGLFIQMEELASLSVKPQLIGAPSPACPMDGHFVMFGPVITTEGASCVCRCHTPSQQHC